MVMVATKTPEQRAARNAYMREWKRRNAEKHRAWSRAWREAHRGHALATQRAYADANRDALRAKDRARYPERQAERRAHPDYALRNRNQTQAYTFKRRGQAMQFEHIVPLSRGGPHCRLNIRPACPHCNQSKKDRRPSSIPDDLLAAWPDLASAW